jgi:hypothetical protein
VNLPSWEKRAVGHRLALGEAWWPTGADSPREGFEKFSIYPSHGLDTLENRVSSKRLLRT